MADWSSDKRALTRLEIIMASTTCPLNNYFRKDRKHLKCSGFLNGQRHVKIQQQIFAQSCLHTLTSLSPTITSLAKVKRKKPRHQVSQQSVVCFCITHNYSEMYGVPYLPLHAALNSSSMKLLVLAPTCKLYVKPFRNCPGLLLFTGK